MTVTEAAACGTPAVVTDIAGHRDAVLSGVTGLLSPDMASLARDITATLADREARERMSAAGLRRAGELTWEATATGTLAALAGEATRLRRHRRAS